MLKSFGVVVRRLREKKKCPKKIWRLPVGCIEPIFDLGIVRSRITSGGGQPARVRQYAHAYGLLAKTDKLDTFNLAEFGKQVKPRQFEAKSEAGRYASALLVRRRQVEEMLKAEKSCLRTVHADMRVSIERMIEVEGRDQAARKRPGRFHERT